MAEPGSIWTVGTGKKIQTLIERKEVSICHNCGQLFSAWVSTITMVARGY